MACRGIFGAKDKVGREVCLQLGGRTVTNFLPEVKIRTNLDGPVHEKHQGSSNRLISEISKLAGRVGEDLETSISCH